MGKVIKSGQGDPYWYEWSVGQMYILDMLYPESNIKSVELQADISLGIDDVVINYKNNQKCCVQVKHTRARDTITFGDLVYQESEDKTSLLGDLAKSWFKEKKKYSQLNIVLYTNREIGVTQSRGKKDGNYKRPALKEFIEKLNIQLSNDVKFQNIKFGEYEKAWEIWKKQIKMIPTDEEKLEFLRLLKIKTEQPDLEKIEEELLDKLAKIFGIDMDRAVDLLARLDHETRRWATSLGNAKPIEADEVYEILAIKGKQSPYNHDFIPAEPFFESRVNFIDDIERELKIGKEKVLFINGIPGVGKTNIISKLSNQRESLIKIRYYSYEPIQPDKEYLPTDVSTRVNNEVFWNELFNQLRIILKGKLRKYNVPLQNNFMSLEELRKRFFELASLYAKDEGIDFIIAIDGIDHAARAGVGKETFLSTLPHPQYLPDNIKILIAGQPSEAYNKYPLWLKKQNDSVMKISVPGIQKKDIYQLVSSKVDISRESEYLTITDLVTQVAEGNTLAAIFAVYEAQISANITELQKRIKSRGLSANITEYYANIWDDAISVIKEHSFIEYKVAGVFAFMNERIDANMLNEIFHEEKISVSFWSDLLKILQPLIIEEDGKFRILHNDVKVFLSSIISCDDNRVREVANSIVDYYLRNEVKGRIYYRDIFKLLKMAERKVDMISVFTPKFVIEAYVNEIETDELENQGIEIMKHLLVQTPLCWPELLDLSNSLSTIEQIKQTKYEIEDNEFRETKQYIKISAQECYVESLKYWDANLIDHVTNTIIVLLENNFKERARNMFDRWFSGMDILDVWRSLESEGMVDEYNNNHYALTEVAKSIANKFGILISKLKKYDMLFGLNKDDDEYNNFFIVLSISYLKSSVETYRGEDLKYALLYKYTIGHTTLIDIIIKLLTEDRYDDIGIVRECWKGRLKKDTVGKMIDLFMKICHGKVKQFNKYERHELLGQLKYTYMPKDSFEYEIFYYCSYAVVLGYIDFTKDIKISASNVLSKYIKEHPNKSSQFYGVLFNLLCMLGRLLYEARAGEESSIDNNDLERMQRTLFLKEWRFSDADFFVKRVYSIILKAFVKYSKIVQGELESSINKVCEEIFREYPVNQLLDAGWYFYKDYPQKIKAGLEYWVGENGVVWGCPIGERNEIIKDILHLINQYNMHSLMNEEELRHKVKWSVIGYASNKEYVFDNILEWYQIAVNNDEANIELFSGPVKELSDRIKEFGDNRLSYHANSAIYSNLFKSGLEGIKNTIMSEHHLDELLQNPYYIIDGLIGYLEVAELSRDKLLQIWAFGIGVLDWRDDSNHSTLAGLKNAIKINAINNGVEDILRDLQEIGKAEVTCYSDPVRYHVPSRWYEKYDCEGMELEESQGFIEEFLTNNEKDTHETLKHLKNLNGKIDKDTFNNMLCVIGKKISEKNRYDWYRNTTMQYIVEVLPNEKSDRIIVDRLLKEIQDELDLFYIQSSLGTVCRWKTKSQDRLYWENGLKSLLNMHQVWMTSGERINLPLKRHDKAEELKIYQEILEVNEVKVLDHLLVNWLVLFVLGDDADRAETALRGLYQLIKIKPELLGKLYSFWDNFHYRAKEWCMMIFELLIDENIGLAYIASILDSTYTAREFNIAIYSKKLMVKLQRKNKSFFIKGEKKKHPFFREVPTYGHKKMIQYPSESRVTIGKRYVTDAINKLENMTYDGGRNLEGIVSSYIETMEYHEVNTYDFGNTIQLKVALGKEPRALLDAVYRDWYYGRWSYEETVLSQVILSSSEPFILLNSAPMFPFKSGRFFEQGVNEFIEEKEEDKKIYIYKLLNKGIDQEEEIVIGGNVIDFNRECELNGYLTTYLKGEGISTIDTQNIGCLNGRTLLINEKDFVGDVYLNLVVRNGGVSSFMNSQLLSTVSQVLMQKFDWMMIVDSGIYIVDNNNEKVIRFENYSGTRSHMGNNFKSMQPTLQRWVMKREVYSMLEEKYRGIKLKHSVGVITSECR